MAERKTKARPKPRKRKPRARHDTLRSLEVTLAELQRLGRIEKIDAARVQHLRSIARALDERPFNAALWKHYGEQLEKLMAHDDDADDLSDELAKLAGVSPDVRNASPA